MKAGTFIIVALLMSAPLFGQESAKDKYIATMNLFLNKDYKAAVQADSP